MRQVPIQLSLASVYKIYKAYKCLGMPMMVPFIGFFKEIKRFLTVRRLFESGVFSGKIIQRFCHFREVRDESSILAAHSYETTDFSDSSGCR